MLERAQTLPSNRTGSRILVIVPAYKVSKQILAVVRKATKYADHVLVVDDACPEGSGTLVANKLGTEGELSVLFHSSNKGVGGAMKTGFDWALGKDFEFIVKVDGDGQINPDLIPDLIAPLKAGQSDFAKGNRFHSPMLLKGMPIIRLIGNGFLTLFSKASSGYWSVSDPTNGFIAISRGTLADLEVRKLADTYFFESDLLFRLSLARARISQLPMRAVYSDESSSMRLHKIALSFPFLLGRNHIKRIVYQYYLRDWSVGSIELPIGLLFLGLGAFFGIESLMAVVNLSAAVSAGQAFGTAVGVILGVQFLLAFLSTDIQAEPRAQSRF